MRLASRVEKLEKRVALIASRADDSLSCYFSDPCGFAANELGVTLTPDQQDILNELRDSPEVNVQSSHGQGKTFLAAIAVLWWVFCVRGWAVTTAPTGRQVKELLWGEIRKLHGANQEKLGGVCQTLTLRYTQSAKALGFSSEDTDENTAQGFHAEHLLVIEDESCGISPAVDDGLTSCLTGENNKILRIGNPVESGTPFQVHCQRKHIKLEAWRHPNVAWAYQLDSDGIHRLKSEVKQAICHPDGTLKPQSQWPKWCPRDRVPGAVSIKWIEEVREKKTEHSSFWISRVEADFPEDATDAIVPSSWFKAARIRYDSNPEHWDTLASQHSWRHGLDVGDGGDEHALASWRGPVLYQVKLQHCLNDRQDVSRAASWAKQRLEDAPGVMGVDRTGVGAGALSQLLEWKCNALGIAWGSGAQDSEQFLNLKSEQFWGLREAFREGTVAVAPLDPEIEDLLVTEFSKIYYKETANEKIQMEAKARTIARLGHSPNAADSVVLGYHTVEKKVPVLPRGLGITIPRPNHHSSAYGSYNSPYGLGYHSPYRRR